MAHILPHWNWPDRVGQVTPVHVYTSGDEGELFLNGESQGRKKKDPFQYRLRWDDVKYEPGALKVITWKNGKPWAEATTRTTGPAAKLLIEPDRARIRNDGLDLSFVSVTVADTSGLMVPRSNNLLRFEITGPGEIVAIDNGDPTNLESFHVTQKNAFNGLCMAIIRGRRGQAGQIKLKVVADSLASAEATIQCGN
jgi:beta-galactosidase